MAIVTVDEVLEHMRIQPGASVPSGEIELYIGAVDRVIADYVGTIPDPVPDNIRLAALLIVAHQHRISTNPSGRPALGITEVTTSDGVHTPSGFLIPARALSLLQPDEKLPGIA